LGEEVKRKTTLGKRGDRGPFPLTQNMGKKREQTKKGSGIFKQGREISPDLILPLKTLGKLKNNRLPNTNPKELPK